MKIPKLRNNSNLWLIENRKQTPNYSLIFNRIGNPFTHYNCSADWKGVN